MIRHQYLNSVGNHNFRIFDTAILYIIKFFNKIRNVKSNACTDDVYCIFVKNTRRHLMKCKFTVIIDYSMACITSALKSDYYISLSGKHISYFSFTFVSPVCSNNSFNHLSVHSYLIYNNEINLRFIISPAYIKSKITIFYICYK